MVDSGLNDDKRTWVSAYKLVIHLSITTSLFGYLFWTWLKVSQPLTAKAHFSSLRRLGRGVAGALFVQIAFGGLMAGMRAGLVHPHFPFFINGGHFWNALTSIHYMGIEDIVDYEPQLFAKAMVQVLHRSMAWILTGLIVLFIIKLNKEGVSSHLKAGSRLLIVVLVVQLLLGIFTVINCVEKIPLFLGVVHQAGALVLFAVVLFVNFQYLRLPKGES